MIENEFYVSKLILGHFRDQLSPEQELELNEWLNSSALNQGFLDQMKDEHLLNDKFQQFDLFHTDVTAKMATWNKAMARIENQHVHEKKNLIVKAGWQKIGSVFAAAASIILVCSIGIYFYAQNHHGSTDNIQGDIQPGRNGATLTLSTGEKISLTHAVNGKLASESGARIIKTADGQVVYERAPGAAQPRNADASIYNILSTANGQQYQIILPDGTKVWLNAASSLKYPASFSGLKERKVELDGEAYFEVAHHVRQPFRIVTHNQLVEDIGTAFNLNAYQDEPAIKTTLVEGSVKVSFAKAAQSTPDVILKPGQQSVNTGGTIVVKNADINQITAWKNGDFIFKNDDFKTIMRQLARWYDVEVVFDASAPENIQLGGYMSRSKNISSILKIMEITGKVHFKTEGRRVIVTK